MRTLSLNLRQALWAPQSGAVAIFLVTISHPDLPEPFRFSTDPSARLSTTPLVYGTTSRGNDYLYVGMEVAIPDEREKEAPQSRLVISNVDRETIPLVRSIPSPPTVKVEAVLASAPNAVEFEIPEFTMTGANYDATKVSFDLVVDDLATEPFPAGSYDPANFAALF